MAEELMYEHLQGTATAVDNDNIVSFQNETGEDLSIRLVDIACDYEGLAANDVSRLDVGKSPTRADRINGDKTPRVTVVMRGSGNHNTNGGGVYANKVVAFAKGQFLLRKNEELSVNVTNTVGTGQSTIFDIGIWYSSA